MLLFITKNFAKLQHILLAILITSLIGCAATQTLIEHRNLEVSTRQSKTIFMDPIPDALKTIYIAIKNTSDQEMEIMPQLKEALHAHGYKVLSNPDGAHYILQANILKIGKMTPDAARNALSGGYGSALTGGLIGGASAAAISNSSSGMLVGGLIGGAVGFAANSLIKEINYTLITDVQVSERLSKGVKINEEFNAKLQNGTSSSTSQNYSRQTKFQRFRTRIVSNANKVNLEFKDARGALEQGLIKTLVGIF